MQSDTSNVRIAVLIDADNTSHRYAEALFEEIAKYGSPTIKRAYGDWSSKRLDGWTGALNSHGIRDMHQRAYTTGKNSTDSALIIDAMDLLYAGNVEAFALVTSDSDFTSLATRLRESGKTVYGLGRRTTPMSLQNTCDKFIQLEVLTDEGTQQPAPDEPGVVQSEAPPALNLHSALTKAVNAIADDEGWTALPALGSHLNLVYPRFDPRTFGHAKLSALVAAQPFLETTGQGNTMKVGLKGRHKAPAKAPAKKAPAKTPAKAPAKNVPAKKAATTSAPA